MDKIKPQLDALRAKDAKALQTQLATEQSALQKARVDLAFGRLKQVAEIGRMRKSIARIQTILKEMEATNA